MPYRALLLAPLLLAATGCAGTRLVGGGTPVTLAEVNRLLEHHEARIVRDADTLAARDVVVATDTTRFLTDTGPGVLATAEVRRILVERRRAAPEGTITAGFIAGMGFTAIGTLIDPSFSLITPFVIGGGAAIGLLLGIGEKSGPNESVAYDGPVERYAPQRSD